MNVQIFFYNLMKYIVIHNKGKIYNFSPDRFCKKKRNTNINILMKSTTSLGTKKMCTNECEQVITSQQFDYSCKIDGTIIYCNDIGKTRITHLIRIIHNVSIN